ncbi:hypothetical protein B0H67DRAFT_586872 [Lasiosphaeris hirsuta]|uniref:Azaphilone pigments biosynthesis cluster protein L N-terminal domain-containing protein n=1 Tax=Lasiosphaeris hirsuta TaxID=260670 RepID=A0AA40AAG7_9PEZI|nr:hypothetical protein B0H67DRAFT_586872 [Lasiosphaeris hirsuta]
MAESIGVASGLLALTAFAFKTSVALYQTIDSFQHHSDTIRDLRNELEALQGALHSLTETAAGAEFPALNLSLLRCGKACHDFEQKILSGASRSGSSRANFRGWAKLRYLGDDVDKFRRMLAGYKSTILIAITDATLRTSTITTENLESHKDMIKVTTANLEDRLEIIDAKLETIFQRTVSDSDEDAAELRQIKEDRLSTQECLQICVQFSQHIDQIQVPNARRAQRSPGLVDPGAVTSQAFQECKEKLNTTAAKLEENMQSLIDRLVKKSKTAMSDEAEAAELAEIQADWKSARECIGICSKADTNLNGNITILDNFATGDDAIQFLVSTNDKIIHGRNRGYGQRPRQLGGHLSDESLQQVSRDMALAGLQHAREARSPSRGRASWVPDDAVEQSSVGFQERYGRGVKLKSESTPDIVMFSSKKPQEEPGEEPEEAELGPSRSKRA